MNSQIKTKEHYDIWYLMIIEMLHINLIPPWNFVRSPCTPSCMHIQKAWLSELTEIQWTQS